MCIRAHTGKSGRLPNREVRIMSVTVVNDYRLKADGDKEEAMAAAAELVDDFLSHHPGVQLSLWLEDKNDPLHHYHITVFDDEATFEKVKESKGIKHFIERYYPHMDQSTHVAPLCDVWLCDGHGISNVSVTIP
jgi:quinol monooxygenase YgiN